ncbi:FMN-binding protein [Clostridium magnum]|uniref:FMN-binding domain protein n=1 Tax=Clostridium magnum DSM 2767 TaxID=1121326 RepID=A0A162SQ86_9CLOT|nr:FMN-binding protein [Clostridium magnum]KZL91727.1 FMN-binding domain protein [Clostridium magnum DSM 2767]SHJ04102.1 Uncharacterized protein, contains FMN-binding domain [Clostridium magnum DSM 2767]
MEDFLDVGLAWISVAIASLLCIIYILRKLILKTKGKNKFIISLNKILRKVHKPLGVLLIITGLTHGIFSSVSVLSLNLGTITWVIAILLTLTWMFRKSLKGWIYYHRILSVIFALVLIAHIIQVTGVFNNKNNQPLGDTNKAPQQESNNTPSANVPNTNIPNSRNPSPNTNTKQQKYRDGTYTGVATGYNPNLTVAVTIKNDIITNIQIVSSNETRPRNAFSVIPSEIIQAQSTNVAAVSRATRSSNGIKDAVSNALSKAAI